MEEHFLKKIAESLLDEAKKEMENNVPENNVKKILSVRLRYFFPKADIFFINETVESVIKKSSEILDNEEIYEEVELDKNLSVEEYGLPIIEKLLTKKLSLISAGLISKNLYREEKISYEFYRTMLHILHTIGRNFLERQHYEVGVKTLENIAVHTGQNKFINKVILMIKDIYRI